MHEGGAGGAIDAAVVALQSPMVLLVGASGDRGATTGADICAFAVRAHGGANDEEEPYKSRGPEDPPDELDDGPDDQ